MEQSWNTLTELVMSKSDIRSHPKWRVISCRICHGKIVDIYFNLHMQIEHIEYAHYPHWRMQEIVWPSSKTNTCEECGTPMNSPEEVCLILPETNRSRVPPLHRRVCKQCANHQYGIDIPPTTKQGEVCRRCGRWMLGPEDDLVFHHLSYENDHMVPMHRSCHSALHQEIRRTQKDGLLKPRDPRPRDFKRYCACGGVITVPGRQSCTKCWRDPEFRRKERRDRISFGLSGEYMVTCAKCSLKFNSLYRTTCPRCRSFFRESEYTERRSEYIEYIRESQEKIDRTEYSYG